MRKTDLIAMFVVSIVGASYMEPYFRTNEIPGLTAYVHLQSIRPFVYRALLPILTQGMMFVTGLPVNVAFMLVFLPFCMGFYFSMKYLMDAFVVTQDETKSIVAVIGFVLFTIFFQFFGKMYDIPNAMFFTFALGLLVRNKFDQYLWLFVPATLNRETTFLLTFFFMVYFWRKLKLKRYIYLIGVQGFIYVSIRLVTMYVFRNNNGESFAWRPLDMLQAYLSNPAKTLPALLIAGAILAVCLWSLYKLQNRFLTIAFLSLSIPLFILHMLMGYPYEFRVFGEVWGLAVSIAGVNYIFIYYFLPSSYRNSQTKRDHINVSLPDRPLE